MSNTFMSCETKPFAQIIPKQPKQFPIFVTFNMPAYLHLSILHQHLSVRSCQFPDRLPERMVAAKFADFGELLGHGNGIFHSIE